MLVRVTRVHIPEMSTIGYGYGTDLNGRPVQFAGDHRPMYNLGEEIVTRYMEGNEAPLVEVEDWQIVPSTPSDYEYDAAGNKIYVGGEPPDQNPA